MFQIPRERNWDAILPENYVSGSVLSGSATYDNTTIAALGLTPGKYSYAPPGLGATADNTFTVNIAAVPEPSSLMMAATAMGLIGGLALRCRRRKNA